MRLSLTRRITLVGAILGAVVLAGAPPAMAATNTGSITGHVTTAAGQPGSDVGVTLYSDDEFGRAPIDWVMTDGAGNFRFGGLATASYTLSFFPLDGPEQFYPRKATLHDADSIAVVNGAATTANEQLLASGTITGQILDPAGNPVPDLGISAEEQDFQGSGWGRTDAEGRYRIAVLPGRYSVSFRPIPDSDQTQYVPGKLDREEATQFEVRAGGEVVVDDRVLPTGTVSGRLTTAAGAPLADADVNAFGGSGNRVSTSADENGEFALPPLLVGSYALSYSSGQRVQYYRGKTDMEQADPVVVKAHEDTRIADSLLPTGSVRVSAVDAASGAAVANFCVDGKCSNGTGKLTINDLPESKYRFYVYTEDSRYISAHTDWVAVQGNKMVDVTVRLTRGALISTTVVDRATGKPVADVCVSAQTFKDPRLPDGYGDGGCTDAAGKITIGPLETGSYNLFADPQRSPYGKQWVGASGGTGDQRSAVTVSATAGVTVAGPQVKLDKAGTIAGQVTDRATGAPVPYTQISLLGFGPAAGPPYDSGADGRYQVSGLGPYAWPLLFQATGYAGQWSGGVANRYQATPISVPAGGTATYNTALGTGVEVNGTFKNQDGEPLRSGHILVHNDVTGDIIGDAWMENGQYSLRVLSNQSIYLSYDVYDGERDYSGDYLPPAVPRRSPPPNPAAGTVAVAPSAPAQAVPSASPTTAPASPGAAVPPPRRTAPAARAATGTAVTATPSATATGPAPGASSADAATGSVPRRPTRPAPGVYLVPASGTLTIDIVINTN